MKIDQLLVWIEWNQWPILINQYYSIMLNSFGTNFLNITRISRQHRNSRENILSVLSTVALLKLPTRQQCQPRLMTVCTVYRFHERILLCFFRTLPLTWACSTTLKVLYPNLFHVTCFAHMMHNCAERDWSYFTDVDNLIAKVKAVIVKNKTRRALFYRDCSPPVISVVWYPVISVICSLFGARVP